MEPFIGQIGLLFFVFLLGIGITVFALPRSPRTIYIVAPVPKVDDGLSASQSCASILVNAIIFITLIGLGLWLVSN